MIAIGNDSSPPEGKDKTRYLPLLYRGLRYPRLARNILENREQVVQQLNGYATGNTKQALSTYRTFHPRFLNYLVKVERNGQPTYMYERRPVYLNDLTPPFVMVCYSSQHYAISDQHQPDGASGDLEALLAVATKATANYFGLLPSHDLEKEPRAFWVAANCMPCNEVTDEDGNSLEVEGLEQEKLANQDVSCAKPQLLFLSQRCEVVIANHRAETDLLHQRHYSRRQARRRRSWQHSTPVG